MKKIAILSPKIPLEQCGVGDYSMNISLQLCQFNFKVLLIGKNLVKCISNKSQIHSITSLSKSRAILGIRRLKYLYKNEYSTLLIQYVPSLYSRIGFPLNLIISIFILKTLGIRVNTVFHETFHRFSFRSKRSFLLYLPCKLGTIALAKLSNIIYTSNDFYIEQLGNYNPSLIRIPSNFEYWSKSINIKNLSINSNKNDTFSICLFRPKRWASSFLATNIDAIISQIPDIQFIILGDDGGIPDINLNTNYLSKFCTITKRLKQNDILKAMHSCHVYLAMEGRNYEFEWNGISTKSGTLATAFYVGMPIIGLDGELTDAILKDCGGVTFIEPNVNSLIEAIKELKADNIKFQNKSIETYSFYKKHLAWKHTLDSIRNDI